jgi:hypothetical protein
MGRLRVSFLFSCVGSLAGHSLAEYFTELLYERGLLENVFHKGINPNNSFVLATILELKQSFNENIHSIGDKLETLSKKFEDENKMLKQEIMSKESEIWQFSRPFVG